MSDPDGLLRQLQERSRRKLMTPKNLAKGSWVSMTDDQVIGRILDEVDELRTAILLYIQGRGSVDDIADEAADVYHFAGMLADPERIDAHRGGPPS